ncbi:unnamed protein product [Gongylonema pulchrum]|uniref:Uma2 domain-containing protein n=1 Tax=Gongylonema pulchrum TaxID=637853 RepID=A0A183ETW0_9BILA|nr:unnamed protein product [Gongylonema pulchrum]
MPFLHESLLLEREEGLSEEEKLEARMLYEREKHIYKNGDFDFWTLRNDGHAYEFEGPRMPFPRMWPAPLQQYQGTVPIRQTPVAMILERAVGNWHNPENLDRSDQSPAGSAVQIITDRGTS